MLGARLDIVAANTAPHQGFTLRFDAAKADGKALHVFEDPALQALIWGDPAQRHEDTRIIEALKLGKPIVAWGRSYFARCKRTGDWRAGTDRLGAFPVLMQSTPQGYVLASHRQTLLDTAAGASPTFSAEATLSLMAFGQVVDHRSMIEGAQHLRGGTTLVFERNTGKCSVEHGAPYFFSPHPGRISFDRAVSAFLEALHRSVIDEPQPLVSISGGLDSRLILAGLLKLGVKPALLCYGPSDSADVQIARDIANTFRLPLFEGIYNAEIERGAVRRIARAGGGEVPYHHGHALMNPELLEHTRGRTLITGTGAETFRAFYYDRGMPGYSVLALRAGTTLLRRKALGYAQQEFGKLLQPLLSVFPTLNEPLQHSLAAMLSPYAHCDLDNAGMLDCLYLGERVRRMVIAGQQLLDGYYVRTHPFMDQQVLDTVSALPIGYRLGSRFHREAIASLSPALAAIPWDKTNRPLANGLRWHERYPALAARLGHQAAWGKQGKPLVSQPMQRVTGRVNGMVTALRAHGIDEASASRGLLTLLDGASATHIRGLSQVLAEAVTPGFSQHEALA